jgi:hypothetical protein
MLICIVYYANEFPIRYIPLPCAYALGFLNAGVRLADNNRIGRRIVSGGSPLDIILLECQVSMLEVSCSSWTL